MGFRERMSNFFFPPEQKGVTVNGSPILSAYGGSRSSRLDGSISVQTATQEGMAASAWLYSAVTTKARAFASVPIVLEYRSRAGWIPAEPGNELQKLLNRPNPRMSMQDLQERWVQHMELAGNSLWHRVKADDGRTLELWPVNPDLISPVRDRTHYLLGYWYRTEGGEALTLQINEVSHWMYQNPADPHWGLAPLRAAALAVDTDVEAQKWNRSVLTSGARPVGAVLMNDTMTDEQWQATNAQVNEQAGGSSNARQVMVFGGATKFASFGYNPTDMDFLDGRKFSRDEISAVIGVPSILVSQGQDATFANMAAAKSHFWEAILVPLLSDFTRTLQDALLPDFGLDAGKWRIRADLSGVPALRENAQAQATTAMTLSKAGFTAESIAKHLQLPLETAAQVTTAAAAVKAWSSLTVETKSYVLELIPEYRDLSPPEQLAALERIAEEAP